MTSRMRVCIAVQSSTAARTSASTLAIARLELGELRRVGLAVDFEVHERLELAL